MRVICALRPPPTQDWAVGGERVAGERHAHTLDTRALTSLPFVPLSSNPRHQKKGKVGPLNQLLCTPASVHLFQPLSRK